MQIFNNYNRQFWLLCLASLLLFSSYNMIIPDLPAFLEGVGGADYKGFIISTSALSALLLRPFSGKLADTIGRVPIMMIGSLLCMLLVAMYPLASSVALFLLLRFLHGFSMGFFPTGTSAGVGDIIPEHKRGEAIGIFGVFTSAGMALGPAIGSGVSQFFSVDIMFYTSALLAGISFAVTFRMKETLPAPTTFQWKLLRIQPQQILETSVWAPTAVMVLSIFAFGVILTIIPDFSTHLGMENKGLFFSVYLVASIGIRLLSGKLSDYLGRKKVLQLALITVTFSLLLLGIANSPTLLLVAAVVFGIGMGMNTPTLFAWTIDLADAKRRGRAMATLYIALEVGIIFGSLYAGWVYDNNAAYFSYVFWGAGGMCIVAFIFLSIIDKKKKRRRFTPLQKQLA